jgi:hypothetical protein
MYEFLVKKVKGGKMGGKIGGKFGDISLTRMKSSHHYLICLSQVNYNTFIRCQNQTEVDLAGCMNGGQCMVYVELSPSSNQVVTRYSNFVKCYCNGNYIGR